MKPNKDATKTEDEKKDRSRRSYSELPDEETTPTKSHKKEGKTSKDIKESWMFRKSKSIKVKNDPLRFGGDGVNFKAKIIGIENVFDARGNRMCQDALQKLKAAVKTSGEHKQRILLNISLLGIRIKDEKSGEILHHHPVHKISFISQDVGDSRAFGYVFGCPQTGHQFFGIKTEKTATLVVCTLRDLFHTALELKKKEIEKAMETQDFDGDENKHKLTNGLQHTNGSSTEFKELPTEESKEESTYSGTNSVNGLDQMSKSHSTPTSENMSNFGCTVDNLLDLQFEMDTLQQGISQMEHSIASAVSVGFGVSFSEDDCMDRNSISSGSSYPMTPRKLNRMSSLCHETLSVSSRSSSTSDYAPYSQDVNTSENFVAFKDSTSSVSPPTSQQPAETPEKITQVQDRYAVFYEIESLQSVFDNPTFVHSSSAENVPLENLNNHHENGDTVYEYEDTSQDIMENEEEETEENKTAKPEVFASLDPLGDHPYVEKEKFFEELRNPPKKVLKELGGSTCDNVDPFMDNNFSYESYPNGEVNPFPVTETTHNPFVATYAIPPRLPPKRTFGVTSPPLTMEDKQENLQSIEEDNVVSFNNRFNPFLNDTIDEISEIPLPTSPPPPPPPRLPHKDLDTVPSMSPPPRPPSRSSAVPTPPRPRRKAPLNATSNWFSFDQEVISSPHFQANWSRQLPSSPPLPIPSRKMPSANKFDLPTQKSSSASNSPALLRRYSNVNSSSTAFKEFSENVKLTNGTSSPNKMVSSPNKKILTRHSSIVHETWGHQAKPNSSEVKNPFDDSIAPSGRDSTEKEVNRIMNNSPPLPPKNMGIARPRPSPSRKMLSAPINRAKVNTSSSSMESKSETVSSGSMRHSSLEESSSINSATEVLFRSSLSSQSDTFSSGYNGEVSGEIASTESSLDKVSPTSPDSIFRRKDDPFADEFFLTLPKKSADENNSSPKKIENDTNGSSFFHADFSNTKMPSNFEDVFETKAT